MRFNSLSLSLNNTDIPAKMKRNCNLELRLERPSTFLRPSEHEEHCHMEDKDKGHKQQQLTIFYKGQITVCDATELQARAIIWLASRESESSESPRFDLASPVCSPSPSSLKRSLKRFLQTRKNRVQATSPYPLTRST